MTGDQDSEGAWARNTPGAARRLCRADPVDGAGTRGLDAPLRDRPSPRSFARPITMIALDPGQAPLQALPTPSIARYAGSPRACVRRACRLAPSQLSPKSGAYPLAIDMSDTVVHIVHSGHRSEPRGRLSELGPGIGTAVR